MRYVVAVSGGVDSVVLLHQLVNDGEHELIVAHFDHGIRPESDADARFVEALANQHGLVREVRREELGTMASEALARERRYEFLHEVAARHDAQIVTAHHQDDLVETVAINLKRGTGWRGLAVLDNPDVYRPLLGITKTAVYRYALKHSLEWVEDETNSTDVYLRNQLRRRIHRFLDDDARQRLIGLRSQQVELKEAIDSEVAQLTGSDMLKFSRYFFTHIDNQSAIELLRAVFGGTLTRPQLERVVHAIKTARSGNVMEAGAGATVTFGARDFIVKTP